MSTPKGWYKEHRNEILMRIRTPWNRYLAAKAQAKRRNKTWNIAFIYFNRLILEPCMYCGGKLPETQSGLDRKDNFKGYILDNVVPCCTTCNSIKSNLLTHQEMLIAMAAIIAFRHSHVEA